MANNENTLGRFEEIIKAHLDEKAASDERFADVYSRTNKNISDCCKYIVHEAKKSAKGSSAYVMTDDEVFGLAAHYYQEDDIVLDGAAKGGVVSVGSSIPTAITQSPAKPAVEKNYWPTLFDCLSDYEDE